VRQILLKISPRLPRKKYLFTVEMMKMFPKAIEIEKAKRELQTACERTDKKVSTESIIGR